MRKASLALAAALSVGVAAQAFAAPCTFFFDQTAVTTTGSLNRNGVYTIPSFTSPSSPLTPGTPTISLPASAIGTSVTLHHWVHFDDPNDVINGLGLNVISSNASVVEASSDSLPFVYQGKSGTTRQYRWTSTGDNTGAYGAPGATTLFSNINTTGGVQDAVGVSALDTLNDLTDASQSTGQGDNVWLGDLVLKVDALGTTHLSLGMGASQTSYAAGSTDLHTSNNGSYFYLSPGDALANNQLNGNTTGAVAGAYDATITVAPEPATLALLGLGGLCLLRRRSSRKA